MDMCIYDTDCICILDISSPARIVHDQVICRTQRSKGEVLKHTFHMFGLVVASKSKSVGFILVGRSCY